MPDETNNNVFYNVMPEAAGGPLVKSTRFAAVTPPPPPITEQRVTLPASGRRHHSKLWILPVAVLLIGLGLGGWLYYKNQTAPEPTPEPIVNPAPEPTPEVTTPAEWLQKYFGAETCTEINQCGDSADPDRDGLTNLEEYNTGTDPNNPDGDGDGIADGDEKHVFDSDPLVARTYRNGEHNDADFVKGGFDIHTDTKYTPERLADIKSLIQQSGLHQPTLTTIGEVALTLYDFTDPNPTQELPANIDQSVQAKLDRDTQRQTTIKKIGAALLAYKADKKSYPPAADFTVMVDMIKPYNTVATNYNDPIGLNQYVYTYQIESSNQDFVLTYYSETQNQLIKYKAADAEATAAKENTAANDDQRKRDLENIQSALLIYSSSQIDPNSQTNFVFPTVDQYKSVLVPQYLSALPTDPVTHADYIYEVSPQFNSFTIRALLQNPALGTTGYLCNENECKAY